MLDLDSLPVCTPHLSLWEMNLGVTFLKVVFHPERRIRTWDRTPGSCSSSTCLRICSIFPCWTTGHIYILSLVLEGIHHRKYAVVSIFPGHIYIYIYIYMFIYFPVAFTKWTTCAGVTGSWIPRSAMALCWRPWSKRPIAWLPGPSQSSRWTRWS